MSPPKKEPPKTDTPKKRPSPTERGFRATRLTLSKAHQRILDTESDFAGVRRSQFLENLLRIRSGSPGGFLRRDGAPVYEFRENDLTGSRRDLVLVLHRGRRRALARRDAAPRGPRSRLVGELGAQSVGGQARGLREEQGREVPLETRSWEGGRSPLPRTHPQDSAKGLAPPRALYRRLFR